MSSSPKKADHPRSRGVYPRMRTASSRRSGSSPLARGLLSRAGRCDDGTGIIPARAGFTARIVSMRAAILDHPRSRGVYSTAASSYETSARIIPARAGFTPRTRPATASTWGSSPLARGLLEDGHTFDLDGRIIPARAGFTAERSRRRSSATDHPRSRGVYPTVAELNKGLHGSSPLARGLPDVFEG